jgi:hypothetical protein
MKHENMKPVDIKKIGTCPLEIINIILELQSGFIVLINLVEIL